MIEAGLIVSRFVQYVSVLLLFGASLFPLYSYSGRTFASYSAVALSLKRVLRIVVGAAFVSLIGWFLFSAAAMADDPIAMLDVSVLATIFKTMLFGKVWAVRLALALVIAALLLRWPRGISYWLVPSFAAVVWRARAMRKHPIIPESNGI